MINYCILAHSNPSQLRKLISHIHEVGQSRCIVHLDKKSDLSDFFYVTDDVYFLENRIDVSWGTYSVVEAIMECFNFTCSKFKNGYFILLSGQDFPIRSKPEIFSYINRNKYKIFIKHEMIPTKSLINLGLDRIENYWFEAGGRGNLVGIKPLTISWSNLIAFYRIIKYNSKYFFKAFRLYFMPKEKIYFKEVYYCEMWWSAPYEIITELIRLVNQKGDEYNFLKNIKIPDETLLQTLIIKNLVKDNTQLINSTLPYIEWSEYRWPRPTTFRLEDFWTIIKVIDETDYLFARKFDIKIDEKIIDKIIIEISQK